jgi:hypothetical protein
VSEEAAKELDDAVAAVSAAARGRDADVGGAATIH